MTSGKLLGGVVRARSSEAEEMGRWRDRAEIAKRGEVQAREKRAIFATELTSQGCSRRGACCDSVATLGLAS